MFCCWSSRKVPTFSRRHLRSYSFQLQSLYHRLLTIDIELYKSNNKLCRKIVARAHTELNGMNQMKRRRGVATQMEAFTESRQLVNIVDTDVLTSINNRSLSSILGKSRTVNLPRNLIKVINK